MSSFRELASPFSFAILPDQYDFPSVFILVCTFATAARTTSHSNTCRHVWDSTINRVAAFRNERSAKCAAPTSVFYLEPLTLFLVLSHAVTASRVTTWCRLLRTREHQYFFTSPVPSPRTLASSYLRWVFPCPSFLTTISSDQRCLRPWCWTWS